MTKNLKFAKIRPNKEGDCMNLLETLKQEIFSLGITDKLKIAQYIYKRTGELFEYDPLWIFSSLEERENLRKKKIDIRNVTDFDITCFSWAVLYNELLHAFHIVSRVKYIEEEVTNGNSTIKKPAHAYVEVFFNGRVYKADLTASYTDMIGIKYGLDTYYNCQLSKTSYEEKYDFSYVSEEIYQKDMNVEALIEKLKVELEEIKKVCHSTEEFSYYVYQKVGELINILKVNTGYVIGSKYVQALLKLFLGDGHLMQNVYFYNKDKSIYIAVHQITVGRVTHYFAYKKMPDGNYEMHEVTPEMVDLYYDMYSYKLSKDLKSSCLVPSLGWK